MKFSLKEDNEDKQREIAAIKIQKAVRSFVLPRCYRRKKQAAAGLLLQFLVESDGQSPMQELLLRWQYKMACLLKFLRKAKVVLYSRRVFLNKMWDACLKANAQSLGKQFHAKEVAAMYSSTNRLRKEGIMKLSQAINTDLCEYQLKARSGLYGADVEEQRKKTSWNKRTGMKKDLAHKWHQFSSFEKTMPYIQQALKESCTTR